MDGKTITNNFAGLLTVKKTEKKTEVKSQESDADCDPDGRRQREGQPNRSLSEEEVNEAIAIIKQLPGFIKNNLNLKLKINENVRVVIIEDQSGKTIRRIEESELCQLLDKSPEQKGKLLSRSA